jgi:hypothetical protein
MLLLLVDDFLLPNVLKMTVPAKHLAVRRPTLSVNKVLKKAIK